LEIDPAYEDARPEACAVFAATHLYQIQHLNQVRRRRRRRRRRRTSIITKTVEPSAGW